MRKLIDIKDSWVPALKHAARLYGKTVKKYIEDTIHAAINEDVPTDRDMKQYKQLSDPKSESDIIDTEPEPDTNYTPGADSCLGASPGGENSTYSDSLRSAARELNELMQPEPLIDIHADDDTLRRQLKQAKELIIWEDEEGEITTATKETLKYM